MEITEVRVKLLDSPKERLKAFCSITLDSDFVVRDLKIIDGANGEFVAMPSRKLATRCGKCGSKNHLRARFCNECGSQVSGGRRDGRTKLHADVAHPINAACRERIQATVIEAYHKEKESSARPDYKPTNYDEYSYDDDGEQYEDLVKDLKKDAEARRKQTDAPEAPVASRSAKPKSATLDDKFGLPLDFDDEDEKEEAPLKPDSPVAEPVVAAKAPAPERFERSRPEPKPAAPKPVQPKPVAPKPIVPKPVEPKVAAPVQEPAKTSDSDGGFGAGLF